MLWGGKSRSRATMRMPVCENHPGAPLPVTTESLRGRRLNARRAGGLKTCARPTFYFESRQTEKKAGRASAARTRQSSLCGSRCGIARRLSLCPSLHLASGRVSTEVAVSLSHRASCGGTVSARAGGPASPLTPRLSPALLPGPCATLRTETPAGTEPNIGLSTGGQ